MKQDDFTEGGSEYDIRQSKLETIGQMVGLLNFFHYRASADVFLPGEETVNSDIFMEHMRGVLRVLFYEGRMYSDDEELINEISNLFEKYGKRNEDDEEVLEEIRIKVSQLIQDGGLDLPRKKNFDPEKAWKEGL